MVGLFTFSIYKLSNFCLHFTYFYASVFVSMYAIAPSYRL